MVLLLDDEADILQVAELVLSRNGYRVHAVSAGTAALEFLAAKGQEVQLIVTDLMMPRMDGVRFAELVRQFGFKMPIIAASGYGEERYKKDFPRLGVKAMLRKPFDAATLLRVVYQAIHGPKKCGKSSKS